MLPAAAEPPALSSESVRAFERMLASFAYKRAVRRRDLPVTEASMEKQEVNEEVEDGAGIRDLKSNCRRSSSTKMNKKQKNTRENETSSNGNGDGDGEEKAILQIKTCRSSSGKGNKRKESPCKKRKNNLRESDTIHNGGGDSKPVMVENKAVSNTSRKRTRKGEGSTSCHGNGHPELLQAETAISSSRKIKKVQEAQRIQDAGDNDQIVGLHTKITSSSSTPTEKLEEIEGSYNGGDIRMPKKDTSSNYSSRRRKNKVEEDKITNCYSRMRRKKEGDVPPTHRHAKSNGSKRKKLNFEEDEMPSSYVRAFVNGQPKLFSRFFPLPPEATDPVILSKHEVDRAKGSQRIRKLKTPSENDKLKVKEKKKRIRQRSTLTSAEKMSDAYMRVDEDSMWEPPPSCHNLLQERHSFDPWRVLVICMLLNITTGNQVRKVLPSLFVLCRNAKAMVEAPVEEIERVIQSLGLQKKRARMIKRFSEEYLDPGWTHVTQLHGIGKYAADAYAIFCVGKPEAVIPEDHKLVHYWKFVCGRAEDDA